MMHRALTRRRFVALSGACAVIATGVSAAAHSLADSAERNALTFGLVQSALWPVDPQHAQIDLQRNAERMAETIRAIGPRCEWLAFHDRALTGGTSLASLATGAVSTSALDSLFDLIATAAKSTSCWVSFGAPSFDNAQSAAQRAELPVALSPRGERCHGPWIDSSLGRIGLAIGEPSSHMIAEAQRDPALAVIAMTAGPRPSRRASRLGAHGMHRLEVSAAHADLRLDCPTQWLGGSAAFDGTGKLLGRCAESSEEILLVALRAV